VRSRLFSKARERFGLGLLDWTAGDIRAILLPVSWVPNFGAEFVSTISLGTRVATSGLITGRAITDGLATGSSAIFPLVFDTRLVSQAVMYVDTGNEATSRLLFYIGDEDLVTEPFIPQGFDYSLNPDAGTGGYFRL